MSIELLRELNGDNKGLFYRFINKLEGEPAIAWYPSSGIDFRSLLYLNKKYDEIAPLSKPLPKHPDLFIHTDYFCCNRSRFLEKSVILKDKNTSITVSEIEELPSLNYELDSEVVWFLNKNISTNRVFFMNLDVKSNKLGNFSVPIIYAFAENATFYVDKIEKCNGKLSYVIHIRYGGGLCGGGRSSGIWIKNVLNKVGCRVFVTDNHYWVQSGDKRLFELYPQLREDSKLGLEEVRKIPGRLWSNHGDVRWYLVNPLEAPRD